MATLGGVITEAIVHHYGRDAFLERLSHSFGAVMGMDWHSSGITTSVIGALKRGLAPRQDELGIYVCGGRGKHSRKTPDEAPYWHRRQSPHAIEPPRRLDSAAVQDGFALYLHGIFVRSDGKWTAVQQGMNGDRRQRADIIGTRGRDGFCSRTAQRRRRSASGRDHQSDRSTRR
jgi:hypothetical protein